MLLEPDEIAVLDETLDATLAVPALHVHACADVLIGCVTDIEPGGLVSTVEQCAKGVAMKRTAGHHEEDQLTRHSYIR